MWLFLYWYVGLFRISIIFRNYLGHFLFHLINSCNKYLLVTEFLEFDSIYVPPKLEKLLRNPYSGRKRKGLRKRVVKKKITVEEEVLHKNSRNGKKTTEFSCQHCGKRYKWKSTMRRHERVECGGKEPTFQCDFCPYKAKQKGNLHVHAKKHHPFNLNWGSNLLIFLSRFRWNFLYLFVNIFCFGYNFIKYCVNFFHYILWSSCISK